MFNNSRTSKEEINTTDLKPYLVYPEGGPEAWGNKGWDYLEDVAKSLPCSSCSGDTLDFVNAFHDVTNIKTGKPVHDPANLIKVKRQFDFATDLCHKKGQCSSKLRPCKGGKKLKLERCIKKLEGRTDINRYAVCKSSLKCS